MLANYTQDEKHLDIIKHNADNFIFTNSADCSLDLSTGHPTKRHN